MSVQSFYSFQKPSGKLPDPSRIRVIRTFGKLLRYHQFKNEITQPIYDDHRALTINSGIPAIDIIDFDYPFWHTLDDTPENYESDLENLFTST